MVNVFIVSHKYLLNKEGSLCIHTKYYRTLISIKKNCIIQLVLLVLSYCVGAFGLRKPWYFPLTASYWKSVCGRVEKQWHSLTPASDFSPRTLATKVCEGVTLSNACCPVPLPLAVFCFCMNLSNLRPEGHFEVLSVSKTATRLPVKAWGPLVLFSLHHPRTPGRAPIMYH